MSKSINLKYVSLVQGKYWRYRPRKSADLKHCNFPVDKNGFLMPPIRLGRVEDSDDQIIRAYQAAKQSLLLQAAYQKKQIGYIAKQYFDSDEFKSKAPRTQRDYLRAAKILEYSLSIDDKDSSLADLCINEITKPLINNVRHSLMKRFKAEGKSGAVIINRQVAWLSVIIKWGLNNIPELPQMNNPLIGIDKFKENKNTRYVTDQELALQCREAENIVDWLPMFIEFTYRIGARGSETCDICESHILDIGVDVTRRKGSKENIIMWTPRLKELVSQIRKLRSTRKRKIMALDPPLFTNTSGDKITTSAIQSAMGRLKKHMESNDMGHIFFSLHKTKSKAQSDSKDDNISGLSTQMKDRYNTKKPVIDTGID